VDNPMNTMRNGNVACPAGKTVFGGGAQLGGHPDRS